jgi:membrane protease YdiL (CAAX protease family)
MGDVLRPVVRLLVGPGAGLPELFLLAAASGIGEEALFRGALQPWLVRSFERYVVSSEPLSVTLGISAATLLFTALHPPLHRDLRPWTIFALVIGFALGGLAAWSGSLAAPIAAHFLMNFFNLRRLLEDPSRC